MPKVDKKWCVYAHSVNDVIVYIGMGNADRAFFIYDRNSRWHKAVLLTKIKEFKLTILKRFVSRDAAQAVIEQARTEDAGGQLHASLKAPLNRLIESYNLGRAGWLTYRAAVKASTPADVASLNRGINALSQALNAFQGQRSIP